MKKMTVFFAAKVTRQRFQQIETYCNSCKKPMQFKHITSGNKYHSDFDFSILCGCGMEIYRWHPKDNFHFGDYYIKTFIPKKKYIKNYNKLHLLEKIGMKKKVIGNGKKEKFILNG